MVSAAKSCPTLCDPATARLLYLGDFPGKNTRVGFHFLLQGIFLTQGLNLGLLRCRKILYHLERKGKGRKVKSLIRVRLFATPWTVAYQTPLCMGFSRQ